VRELNSSVVPPTVGAGAQAVLRRYNRRADAPAAQDPEIHRLADLLLRLGDVLVSSGAATSDVEAAVIAAANALGVPRTEVDITFNAVTVTLLRDDGPPVTQVRVVRQRSASYDRLAEVHNLLVDLVDNGITRREASVRLSAIEAKKPDYPRWLVSLAWGVLAAAVTQLLGGTLFVAAIAFGSTVIVDQLGRLMRRIGWPEFYFQVVGGFVVTLIAAGLTAADVSIRPSLVVVGGIIVLLAGLGIVATVQDALTGFVVTAAGRGVEVALMTAGIIAGVSLALLLARRLEISMGILPPATSALVDIPARTVAAAIGAASFAVAYQTPRRLLVPCAAIGALSYVTWYAMQQSVGASALSAATAAVAVGLAAHVIALRLNAPPLVVVVPGLVLLLPGVAIYRGLLLLNGGATADGIVSMIQAGTIGLALAAGVLVGEILGQPVRRELSRAERRFARPRMVGPARLRIQRRQRG
jgi:uncharacterized membrane protein YjjP (DUF1212 family)